MMALLRSSKSLATARAQVLGTHDSLVTKDRIAGASSATNPLHSVAELRVVPDDGRAEFQSRLSMWGGAAGLFLPTGCWTYVRYEPHKPESCTLDKDRLVQEFGYHEWGGGQVVFVPRLLWAAWDRGDYLTNISQAVLDGAPSPTAQQRTGAKPRDVADELMKLAALRDRGVLTDAEFQVQKEKLLAD